MHAFLITGQDSLEIEREIEKIIKSLKSNAFDFTLEKIADVREINKFIALQFKEATTIIIRGIHRASIEALNAFLKNLEEPQESLSFILTANSEKQLIPTIVSRCHVIRLRGKRKLVDQPSIHAFIKLSEGEKLAKVDKIRDRDEAIAFLEEYIFLIHQTLKNEGNKKLVVYKNWLQAAQKARKNLLANGNVRLQLSNFVIGLS